MKYLTTTKEHNFNGGIFLQSTVVIRKNNIKKIEKKINILIELLNNYWNDKYFKIDYKNEIPFLVLNNSIKSVLLPSNFTKKNFNDKIFSHILHSNYDGSKLLEQINSYYTNANNDWNKFVEIMNKLNKYKKNNRVIDFETYDLLINNTSSHNKNLIITLLKNISYNFQLLGIYIQTYYYNIIRKEISLSVRIRYAIKDYLEEITKLSQYPEFINDVSVYSIYIIIFSLVNYKKFSFDFKKCDNITQCKDFRLQPAKSLFYNIYKLTSDIFSGKLFSIFFYLIKNSQKNIKEYRNNDFNIYPLHKLFEIVYNIHYTSKYIHIGFQKNACKLRKIIPKSNNYFINKLRYKFSKHAPVFEMDIKNNFGFKDILHHQIKQQYSTKELARLQFSNDNIKLLKNLYNSKIPYVFRKKKLDIQGNRSEDMHDIEFNINKRITSNFKDLFNIDNKSNILKSLDKSSKKNISKKIQYLNKSKSKSKSSSQSKNTPGPTPLNSSAILALSLHPPKSKSSSQSKNTPGPTPLNSSAILALSLHPPKSKSSSQSKNTPGPDTLHRRLDALKYKPPSISLSRRLDVLNYKAKSPSQSKSSLHHPPKFPYQPNTLWRRLNALKYDQPSLSH